MGSYNPFGFRAPQDIPMFDDPYQQDQAPSTPTAPVENLGSNPYGLSPAAPSSVSTGAPAPQRGGFWGGVRNLAGGYGRGMWDSLRGGMRGGMYQRPGAGGMGYRMGYGRPAPNVSRETMAPVTQGPEPGTLSGTITRTAPSQPERIETQAGVLRR